MIKNKFYIYIYFILTHNLSQKLVYTTEQCTKLGDTKNFKELAPTTLVVKTNFQFRAREISQGTRKLVRTSTFKKKKKTNTQLLASGSEKKKKAEHYSE